MTSLSEHNKMKKVKRTERGWAAHLCVANQCRFKRNTLLEYGKKKIVVSTIGKWYPRGQETAEQIGCDSYFETMAFKAIYEKPYWEADVTKQISFDSDCELNECEHDSDLKANDIHEKVVNEITTKLESGEKFTC